MEMAFLWVGFACIGMGHRWFRGNGLVGLYIWWLGTPFLYPMVTSASRRKNIYMSLMAGFLVFPSALPFQPCFSWSCAK